MGRRQETLTFLRSGDETVTTAAKGDPRRLALGLGLVLLGLLWLLGAFHLLPVWRLAMLAVAAGFLGLAAVCGLAYRRDPATRYGFLVPAGVLVSLSLSVLLESLFRRVPDPLHALVFFAGPALAFARIYTLDRRRGWALISASLCGVLGATASLGELRVFHGISGAPSSSRARAPSSSGTSCARAATGPCCRRASSPRAPS